MVLPGDGQAQYSERSGPSGVGMAPRPGYGDVAGKHVLGFFNFVMARDGGAWQMNSLSPSGALYPGVAEAVAAFPGPVYGFVSQPQLQEFAATTREATGRVVQIGLSYSFLRLPQRPDDPVNFIELTAEQRQAIERASASTLPGWLKEQIARMRYPTLFDAVRTSVPIPAERAHPIEARLAAHMLDTLQATRPRTATTESAQYGFPPLFHDDDVIRGMPVRVDGETVRSYRVETHPDIVGVGIHHNDAYVTAVVPKGVLPAIDLAFTLR